MGHHRQWKMNEKPKSGVKMEKKEKKEKIEKE